MGGNRSVERGTPVLLLLERNEEEPLPDVKEAREGTCSQVTCGSLKSAT